MNFINVAGQMRASEEWRGNRSTTVYDTKGGTKKGIRSVRSLLLKSSGTTLQQLDYRYDNAGNRSVMIEGGGSA